MGRFTQLRAVVASVFTRFTTGLIIGSAVVVLVLALQASLSDSRPRPVSIAVAASREADHVLSTEEADSEICRVEPRPFQEIAALESAPPGAFISWGLGTPVASPAPPPRGVPANQTVVEAITAVVREHVACTNLGDMPRITALWTDELLQRQLGGIDSAMAVGLATPHPVAEAERATLISVDDVETLPDGLVTAVVRTDKAISLVAFREVDGRYVIDGGYMPDISGTPTPPSGTPTP